MELAPKRKDNGFLIKVKRKTYKNFLSIFIDIPISKKFCEMYGVNDFRR